jgi:hypothetical protein
MSHLDTSQSQAPTSLDILSGPLHYKASGLKHTLHGVIYQLKLLMLFLKRGFDNGYTFRLATEMDDAEKFDDVVFCYKDGDTAVIRFLQAKHRQDITETISETDLLNEKDGDFSLQKYFISYLKITKNLTFSGAELKDFIIFTNIGFEQETRKWFERIKEKDPILSMTFDNSELLKMRLTDLKGGIEELFKKLRNSSDSVRLVNKIRDYDPNETLNLREPLYKQYHEALVQNVIDVKTGKYKDAFVDDTSLTENVKKFRDLLKEGNLPEDKFKEKLRACTFTTSKGFRNIANKEQKHLLPDDKISQEEIDEFLSKLVFAVKQPTEIDLWGIIKSEIREFHNMKLNDMDLMASELQTKVLDWMKNKEGLFFTTEDGQTLFNGVNQKIAKLMFAGITMNHRINLDDFGIAFENEQAHLNEFMKNENKNQIFNLIVQGNVILGSVLVHQTISKCTEIDYLNVDDCIFVSLSSLLRLRTLVNLAFQSTKLVIIEFGHLRGESLINIYLDLCKYLKLHSDKKLVLITQELDSSTTDFPFKSHDSFKEKCQEYIVKLTFTELNALSRNHLLEGEVNFQGKTMPLNNLMSKKDKRLMNAIDGDMLLKLMNREEIHIGKPLTGLGEMQTHIARTLQRAVRMKPNFKKDGSWFIVRDDVEASKLQWNKAESQNVDIVVVSGSSTTFYEVCSQVRYNECNIHWFREDGEVLKWQQTRGKVSRLRERILNEVHDDTKIELTQISDQLVIISSEAGMGKSTLMSDLANNTKDKKAFHTKWVIKINLNDCTGELQAIDSDIDKDKAVEFLLSAANIESDFDKAFLKNMMEEPGCVFLFIDGFDEISPHYKKKVLDLILAYKNTKIENIWVTSRPHLKQELEDKLGTFAYTLNPLSRPDQESLIKKFWETKIGHKVPEDKVVHIKQHVKEILDCFSQSIADTNAAGEFAGIPLQTVLLAEYFYDNVKAFCASGKIPASPLSGLNILDLYIHFIEKKYKVYCEEKKC